MAFLTHVEFLLHQPDGLLVGVDGFSVLVLHKLEKSSLAVGGALALRIARVDVAHKIRFIAAPTQDDPLAIVAKSWSPFIRDGLDPCNHLVIQPGGHASVDDILQLLVADEPSKPDAVQAPIMGADELDGLPKLVLPRLLIPRSSWILGAVVGVRDEDVNPGLGKMLLEITLVPNNLGW